MYQYHTNKAGIPHMHCYIMPDRSGEWKQAGKGSSAYVPDSATGITSFSCTANRSCSPLEHYQAYSMRSTVFKPHKLRSCACSECNLHFHHHHHFEPLSQNQFTSSCPCTHSKMVPLCPALD